MKKTFCTIVTGNYVSYAVSQYDSLRSYDPMAQHFILSTDTKVDTSLVALIEQNTQIQLLYLEDLAKLPLVAQAMERYANTDQDALRWTLKPLLLNYLLANNYDKVIYIDWDIYFFSNYDFLWNRLEDHSLLLSPHFRCSDPQIDAQNFKLNFTDGIYNGGFVGANKAGIDALNFWAQLCLYKCEVDRANGFYVDQKYLDILPSRFSKIGSITHKGCNVANWNQHDCKRESVEGQVLINGEQPVVFIHFTNSFFKGVLQGSDGLLKPHLEVYNENQKKYSGVDLIEQFYSKGQFKNPRPESKLTTETEKKGLFKKLFKS